MKIEQIKAEYDKHDGSLCGQKNIDDTIALLFQEHSKLDRYTMQQQAERSRSFSTEYMMQRWSQPYKCYPGREQLDLSAYTASMPAADLFTLMAKRRSVRRYNNEHHLSIAQLATILYHAYGVTRKEKLNGLSQGHMGLRQVPSAGGLYPLELYLVTFRADVKQGLYHYRADLNCLEKISEGDHAAVLKGMVLTAPAIDLDSASAMIIITGVAERVLIKYGDRGYRFLLQESGAVGMMISLLAEASSLGACCVGAYNDDLLHDFLDVDGVFEAVNNVIIIGGKPGE